MAGLVQDVSLKYVGLWARNSLIFLSLRFFQFSGIRTDVDLLVQGKVGFPTMLFWVRTLGAVGVLLSPLTQLGIGRNKAVTSFVWSRHAVLSVAIADCKIQYLFQSIVVLLRERFAVLQL